MAHPSSTLEPPAPETTVVVLLGASKYPQKPAWSNPVLGTSARAFRDYVLSPTGFTLAAGQVLDLFDSDADAADQLFRINKFLRTTGARARDLIVYYVGHGGFDSDDYHLGIRTTQRDQEFFTTIESRKLARVIREGFGRKRVYVILDSCFAAGAARDWQGDEIEAAVRKMSQPLPRQGTAFLAAASKDDVTRAPRDERYTVFTGAILDALTRGVDRTQPRLSLYELYEEVRDRLQCRETDEQARPELHVPSQRDGDVSRLPLFPNVAYLRSVEADRRRAEAAEAAEAERLRAEAAVRAAAEAERVRAEAAVRAAAEADRVRTEAAVRAAAEAVRVHAEPAAEADRVRAEAAVKADRLRAEAAARSVTDVAEQAAIRWRDAAIRELWPIGRRLRRFVIGAVALLALLAAGYQIATRWPDHSPTPDPVISGSASWPTALANEWVRVAVPGTPIALGIEYDGGPATIRGFRPARKIVSPSAPYELQEHEVTWSEIEPWLASSRTSLAFPPWAETPAVRASLPVTGVTWSIALAYCRSLGGSLPSEEQWEYTARGPGRRPNSWGADRLDPRLTHAYAGPNATPAAVKTNLQDQTPAPAIYDLIGNVQEWTLGLWRDDLPGADEPWVESGKTSIRAIRGLPLGDDPPPSIQAETAAYRDHLCATGPCVDRGADLRRYVGFRCARA